VEDPLLIIALIVPQSADSALRLSAFCLRPSRQKAAIESDDNQHAMSLSLPLGITPALCDKVRVFVLRGTLQGDRRMHRYPIGGIALFMFASLIVSSCSNPEAQKLRHVERGDEYVKDKKDQFAVVEYASAVQIDPKYGEARLKLAETYERMHNVRAAFPEFIRAADALPDNREAQIKATQLLLLAGRFEDAKMRADGLLKKNPKDIDAILLRANALAGLRDPAGAIAQIDEALKISPDNSRAFVNLGAVRVQSGQAKEAEVAFRHAIELDSNSLDAKLALANFLWAAERGPEAEAVLKEVLAKDPKHLLANRMLGTLFIASKRVAEAEQPLKNVAETSNAPAARFQLADYYISVGRPNDAVTLLNALAKEQESSGEAELRLAALDYTQHHVEEAHKRLDSLLTRAPNYSAALVLKSQWLSSENKLDEALERAKAAVAAEPQSAPAHFALAVAQDRRREVADAIKSYQEVLRLNPRAVAAQVALSRLNLTAGNSAGAQKFAEEARQTQPSSLDARVALVRSLIAAGNSSRAEVEIRALLKDAPNVAVVHALNGMHQARVNNPKAARIAYERALELSPGFVEAIGGLTYLDLLAKDPASAINRLDAELVKQPTNAALFGLLARVHSVTGDKAKEEQALRRAVTVDPRFSAGYEMLARMYLQQNRIEEARAEFEGIAQRDPSNIGAKTMVGVLLEQQGKRAEATKAYEAAVQGTENAPVAANNLAYIYAEQGTNLDLALQLATSAKQRLPNDPGVDDTIGWVYYKKGLPSLAVKAFEDSVKKRPDNAETLFHLGLTYAKLGDKAKAREALERALKLDPNVGGQEARQVLASVSG
jgi:tetratricopeptide (TPR) repeat protein